jgi:hypothetical protein
MMSTDDNVYGTWAGEPANEDNWDDMGMTPEQQFDILFGYAEERHRGYTYMDEVAPHGSENIDEVNQYDYSDGYEH